MLQSIDGGKAGERKGKRGRPKKEEKKESEEGAYSGEAEAPLEPLKTGALRALIIPMLEGYFQPDGLTPFGRKFWRYRPEKGAMQIMEIIDDSIVKLSTVDEVVNALCSWAWRNDEAILISNLKSSRTCRELTYDWLAGFSQIHIDTFPRAVGFVTDPDYVFHRLDFDLKPQETLDRAPTWKEALSRMSNAEAFAMRVASLFDPDAQRRQAIWLSGEGRSGKSIIAEALLELFAEAGGKIDDEMGSFWKAPLVGKRLVVLDEAPASFLRSAKFKAITGDDFHLVNSKGERQFLARIDAIFLFVSNDEPHVGGDEATLSRIIDCRITPVPVDSRVSKVDVQDRLREEMPYFLGWGWKLYQERKDQDGLVPCSRETLLESVDEHEMVPKEFLLEHFVREEGRVVFCSRMAEILRLSGHSLSNRQQGEWRKVWEREGVKKEKRYIQETRDQRWVYVGLRERRPDEKVCTIVRS